MSSLTPSRMQRSRYSPSGSTALRSKMNQENRRMESGVSSRSSRSRDMKSPQQPLLSSKTSLSTTADLPSRRNLPSPRTVTPPAGFGLSAPSWEDFDEGVYGAASRNKSKRGPNTRPSSRTVKNSASFGDEEDMPMDEMMHTRKATTSSSNPNKAVVEPPSPRPPQVRLGVANNRSIEASAVNSRPGTVSASNSFHSSTDEASSLGDVENQFSNVARLVAALQAPNPVRPTNLTNDEKKLWDSIQRAMASVKKEQGSKRKELERQLQDSSATIEMLSTRETELEMQVSASNSKLSELQQQLRHSSSEDRGSGAANTGERVKQLEDEVREVQSTLKEKETEHDLEIRAIQRVLADVTLEREEETQELSKKIGELTLKLEQFENGKVDSQDRQLPVQTPEGDGAGDSSSKEQVSKETSSLLIEKEKEIGELQASVKALQNEKSTLRRDADKKSRRLIVVERDYKVTKAQLNKSEEEKVRLKKDVDPLREEVENLRSEIIEIKKSYDELKAELEEKEKQLQQLRRKSPSTVGSNSPQPAGGSGPSEDVDNLRRNLKDTTASLENAKKIIASLENANGSLALDLRAKLKAKEEELALVQKESTDRKRRLDSLATELRDLQRKQGDAEHAEKQTKAAVLRMKALTGQMEKYISGLQSASVVHEVATATGQADTSNVDQISEIIGDAILAVKTTVDMAERYVDEFDDQSVAFTDVEVSSEVGRHIDSLIRNDREAAAKDLRVELDQKKIAVRRLEDALKKQNEEMKRLRLQLNERGRGSTETEESMRAEIQSLREQCSTNMEVLAKKERELSVLRSSLKVDENDAGYISDDASDADDDETDTVMSPARLNGYGPAETEALATLLSTGQGIDVQGRSREVESVKSELAKAVTDKEKAQKDLQTERESLANAKMIISSLEKANKSMMEDLRSRLQESNTAIASLLDKSMAHEKTSNSLREELEALKKEKEETEKKHQVQVKRLKDEAKVYSLRVTAKDRELGELRKGVATKAEEKKENE